MIKKIAISEGLICGLIILLAFFLQSNMYLHGDVGYLLYISKFLSAGGTYGKDFFETNPPLILYLYWPIWSLVKWTSLTVALATRIYLFSLLSLAFLMSVFLLKKIMRSQFNFQLLMYGLLFILFFLPANQFGQREHLFLAFFIPYLFSTALYVKNEKRNKLFSFLVGVTAGIAFCIKPFFLLPFFMIELYLIVQKKNILGWIRIESLAICTVGMLYALSIWIFQPNYLHVIVPLVAHFYFTGITESWITIFSDPIVVFILFAWSCYFIFRRYDDFPQRGFILFLGLTGTILAFLFTRTTWYFHLIPACGMAVLSFFYYITNLTSSFHRGSLSKSFMPLFISLSCIGVFCSTAMSATYKLSKAGVEDYYQGPKHDLINYLSQVGIGSSVVCFSMNTTHDCFPLIFNIKGTYASRYPFFWWSRGVLALKENASLSKLELQKEFLFTSAAEDLNFFKPQWVVIDSITSNLILGPKENIIKFLSQNSEFREAWKPYRYLTMIDDYYEVYKRQ